MAKDVKEVKGKEVKPLTLNQGDTLMAEKDLAAKPLNEEVLPEGPEALAAEAAAASSSDPDELLFEKLVEPKSSSRRGSDENSAFSKFKDFIHRMLKVAEKKNQIRIRVGRLVQGAVDAGIFDDVPSDQRYRRGYNYFVQQFKDLPAGWTKVKYAKKNHVFFQPTTAKKDVV